MLIGFLGMFIGAIVFFYMGISRKVEPHSLLPAGRSHTALTLGLRSKRCWVSAQPRATSPDKAPPCSRSLQLVELQALSPRAQALQSVHGDGCIQN